MKMKIAVLLSILLTGCATQQVTLKSTFNEKEASVLMEEGKNTIKGSALIRQNNGGTVTCAGKPVYLAPVTESASERILHFYKNTERGYMPILAARNESAFANDDPKYAKYTRNVTCDAQGFFKFEKVADGSFYVVTNIQWRTNPYLLEGGALMARVSVKGGEVKEITLAP